MVKTVSSEQVGSALRRLAEDLVAARRRIAELERENRELRAQVEALEGAARGQQKGNMRPSPKASVRREA